MLTSDKLEVVVLLSDFCFVFKPSAEIKNIELEKINWTTAFFAALVYEMLTKTSRESEEEKCQKTKTSRESEEEKCQKTKTSRESEEKKCREMIEQAIDNAHKHSGVMLPSILQMSDEKSCRKGSPDNAAGSSMPETKVEMICDWQEMKKKWEMAKKDKGIIISKDDANQEKQCLEIWRASTDLPGYIACIQEKREAIQRIWQKINAFALRKDNEHSLSILLEADPAVGKSYLARKLKENILNCSLVQHDITQMIERAELLDLFDMVANEQAKSSGPVFVFVDEINATLGGRPVYGAFLSPLEAGNYMRSGQRIELKPCIWMFAGTRTPHSSGMDEKREDFESRMTLIERIDYDSIIETSSRGVHVAKEASLEQVYLGAKMINDAFNDVRRIDCDVLEVFATLPPEKAPARLIKRLTASLENVQYGRVHKGNCTSLEWEKIIEDRIRPENRWKWTREFQPWDDNVIWVALSLN